MSSDAGSAFQTLVDIMARLRGPQGCPWDRQQTLESLRGFVLEETHEVLEAIDRGDTDALRGEIGDLIFEGVFLAQICADQGHFTVADSLKSIAAKLVRRHPHIFDPAGRPLDTPGEVHQQWEQIKAREQTDAGERRSVLRGVPRALPSLLRAHEIATRAAAVGFDWTRTTDVVDKIEEDSQRWKSGCTPRDARCMTRRWRRWKRSGRSSRLTRRPTALTKVTKAQRQTRRSTMRARHSPRRGRGRWRWRRGGCN